MLVAEQHEVLAEQPHRERGAARGQLLRQRGRLPVAAHQLPHALPGPMRVSRSFSSRVGMLFSPPVPAAPTPVSGRGSPGAGITPAVRAAPRGWH